MKKYTILLSVIFVLPFVTGCDDKYSPKGEFSFDPPAGWKVEQLPGLKYKTVVGPERGGFMSNINVDDEPYAGTLDEFVRSERQEWATEMPKHRFIAEDKFKTTSGLTASRTIIENESGGRWYRQTFYWFKASGTIFGVCCSTLAEGGEQLDAVFEESMKTFRLYVVKKPNAADEPARPGTIARESREINFVPPEGWKISDGVDVTTQCIVHPSSGEFDPCILVSRPEVLKISLEAAVNNTRNWAKNTFSKYHFIKEDRFKTTSGLIAVRVVWEGDDRGVMRHTTVYIFSVRGMLRTFTCSSTIGKASETVDAVFEKSMRTFNVQ